MAAVQSVVDNYARLGEENQSVPPVGIANGFTGTLGDLVDLSSGAVNQAAAAGIYVANTVELGVLADVVATGTTSGTLVAVAKVQSADFLQLPVGTQTGGSLGVPVAVTGLANLLGYVGQQFGICRATAGPYYLNLSMSVSGTTFNTAMAEIVDIAPADVITGVTNAICRPIAANRMA